MTEKDETRIVKTVAMPAYLWGKLEASGALNDRSVTAEITAIVRREFALPELAESEVIMTEKQCAAYDIYIKARKNYERTTKKEDAHLAGKAWGSFMRLYEQAP